MTLHHFLHRVVSYHHSKSI